MFQDTKECQTHSFGDGCGEPEHNVPAKWEERFDRKFNYIGAIDSVVNDRSLNIREVNIVNDIKDFIREAISEAVEEERKRILKIVKKKDVKELFPNVDVTVPDKMLSEAVLKKEGYNIAVDEILSILNCKS